MTFTVPPPPQTGAKTSPSGFPVKSTSFRKTERKPTHIVIHYTAGWQVLDKGAGTVDFLMNGRKDYPSGLSYHYIISVDGHIENVIDPKYQAFHGGLGAPDPSIGISLSSLGTTFEYLGLKGANEQVDSLRKSPNKYRLALYGKNEDYVKLINFEGQEKKYRNFSACQEVSAAQIGALESLLKSLKNKFPSLPGYSGLTKEHFDMLFPELGTRNGDGGSPSFKRSVPGIYTHCSITQGKVDIAPTPRLVNFFRRLRL
jgi:N-acetyl-anhydromuramyl-L-alanine amidase AmpD